MTACEWDHPEPFVIHLTARAAEVDSYGAWAHSAAVGLPEARCLELRRGMAVRSVRLDYLAAAHAGDEVRVGNWICASDVRLRVSRRFQLIAPLRGLTLLRGEIDYVCLNLDSGRPVRMPAEFAAGYAVTIAAP
jgi:acyl-CoA thioester hydrolase